MAKKVIIIESSARKNGNSNTLCEQFAAGARDSGNVVEVIDVNKLNIHFCTGCNAHVKTGKCVFKDDMESVIQKMIDADVYVFATPVYFYSMSGQLKTFIDRLVPRYLEMTDKEIYLIVTAWDSNVDDLMSTVEAIRGLTRDCFNGAKEKGVILGGGLTEIGDAQKSKYIAQAYQMGKNV